MKFKEAEQEKTGAHPESSKNYSYYKSKLEQYELSEKVRPTVSYNGNIPTCLTLVVGAFKFEDRDPNVYVISFHQGAYQFNTELDTIFKIMEKQGHVHKCK